MTFSILRSYEDTRNSETTIQEPLIKVDSRDILSVAFADSDFTAMMSFTLIAETNMKDVTSVIESLKDRSRNTM
jgi:hypothetical protein